MIQVNKIKTNNKLPYFIRRHPILTEFKTIKKVFPSIGLENFSINYDIKDDAEISQTIKNLLYDMYSQISPKFNNLFAKSAASAFYELYYKCCNARNACNIDYNNFLYLKRDIKTSNIIIAKKGEKVFKAYTKLIDKINLPKLENLPSFKTFSSLNTKGNFKICFSSDKEDGVWDLATMSMRGISSCQSWTGAYKQCLIGSILDPNTAIIYITSGSQTKYGSKMLRRAVVRYLTNKKTNKPALYIDRMYPAYDSSIAKEFKKALSDKLKIQIPIYDELDSYIIKNNYEIPLSARYLSIFNKYFKVDMNRAFININAHSCFSYRDTEIPIKLNKKLIAKINKLKISSYYDKNFANLQFIGSTISNYKKLIEYNK